MSLPSLYIISKTGKKRLWTISVENNTVVKVYGEVGGKMITTSREIKAVNKGKSNEISCNQQANHVAEQDWAKQLDKGYRPDDINDEHFINTMKLKQEQGGKNTTVRSVKKNITKVVNHVVSDYNKYILPMCANVFSDNWKKYFSVEKGLYLQPKLDGFRCIAQYFNGEVVLTTRSGKQFPWLKHIREELKPMFKRNPDIIFDGEIYSKEFEGVDTDNRFNMIQSICSMSTKKPHPREKEVQYWVFDIIETELNQVSRYELLDICFDGFDNASIVLCPTYIVNDMKSMEEYHASFLEDGFEGTMLRDSELMYVMKNRSQRLRKYKNFSDSEFEIIGAKEGEGTEKGCVVWKCKTKTNKEFDCRPKGSFEKRIEMWKNHSEFIGKLLKVEYQELTNEGIPRFPRGICIRDEFDI